MMYRIGLSGIIGAALVALGLVGLGVTLSQGIQKFKAAERSVEVKGLAEREVPANLAIWGINHTDADNDLTALYGRFETKNAAIAQFLATQGFEPKEITVGAPSVVDRQARDYGEQNSRFRYSGRATVTVYTPQVDKVRAALGKLGELGRQGIVVSNEGQGVMFVFDGLNEIKPAMVEQAVRNARETAAKFATDTASSLGKLKRAQQGQFSIEDRDASTPHIKKVRVVSTLEYYLEH